ncbi:MAG TPA: hypothetical protein VNO30_47055 [Kofleriaceae bacterium]|nr:hypothetical protein [Kofleriaceae bacterium]
MRYFLVLATLLGGCLADTNDTDSSVSGNQGIDQEGCKVEGSQIGQIGLAIDLGSRMLTFSKWIPKSDSPGEYAGFNLTLAGGGEIHYIVKAGGELHPSESLSWVHPSGISGGAKTPGISNIDLCQCDNYDDGGDGGGGGTGGGDTGGGGSGPIL